MASLLKDTTTRNRRGIKGRWEKENGASSSRRCRRRLKLGGRRKRLGALRDHSTMEGVLGVKGPNESLITSTKETRTKVTRSDDITSQSTRSHPDARTRHLPSASFSIPDTHFRPHTATNSSMCIIFFAFRKPDIQQQGLSLVIAANRDEFIDRPTQSADYWSNAPHVIGGLDLGHVDTREHHAQDRIVDEEFFVVATGGGEKNASKGSTESEKLPSDQDEEMMESLGIDDLHKSLLIKTITGFGTWLGVSKYGSFAFLTNYREESKDILPTAISRGILVRDFLLMLHPKAPEVIPPVLEVRSDGSVKVSAPSTTTTKPSTKKDGTPSSSSAASSSQKFSSTKPPTSFAEAYARTVALKGPLFNGFNLVVGSLLDGEAWYVTNRGPEGIRNVPFKLEEGRAYGLSNATLFTGHHWPKVRRGTKGFWKLLREKVMGDREDGKGEADGHLAVKGRGRNRRRWGGILERHAPHNCPISMSLLNNSFTPPAPDGLFATNPSNPTISTTTPDGKSLSQCETEAETKIAQTLLAAQESAVLSALTDDTESDTESEQDFSFSPSRSPTRSIPTHVIPDTDNLIESLLNILRNNETVPDHQLPMQVSNIGLERLCAPICIDKENSYDGRYGTRTHTVVVVQTTPKTDGNGEVEQQKREEGFNVQATFVEVDRYVRKGTLSKEEKEDELAHLTFDSQIFHAPEDDGADSSEEGGIAGRIKRRHSERVSQVEKSKQEREKKRKVNGNGKDVEYELCETRREFRFSMKRFDEK
ncbi:hypothetical protein HDV05_005669 [Chytridiales sp. JEL 0842]|nr:hypothetical protein HDV05_005669 [Chytridiales sp. JEL 0842]